LEEQSIRQEEALQETVLQEHQAEIAEEFQSPLDTGDSDESSLTGKVNKLQRIVKLQKDKILDLMCYKDIFEGAQKKLTSIQQGNEGLHERFVKLLGTSIENPGLAEAMETFKQNNNEIESYINILESENQTLSEKFRKWEDELKRIWEKAESGEFDEGRYNEILKEREELMTKMKDFEDKLQEKSKLLNEMQAQYEDLEKEYMILYRQQQQQQK
jgi:hypothetical protein